MFLLLKCFIEYGRKTCIRVGVYMEVYGENWLVYTQVSWWKWKLGRCRRNFFQNLGIGHVETVCFIKLFFCNWLTFRRWFRAVLAKIIECRQCFAVQRYLFNRCHQRPWRCCLGIEEFFWSEIDTKLWNPLTQWKHQIPGSAVGFRADIWAAHARLSW